MVAASTFHMEDGKHNQGTYYYPGSSGHCSDLPDTLRNNGDNGMLAMSIGAHDGMVGGELEEH